MLPPNLKALFESRLKASKLAIDTVNSIVKTGNRNDVPTDLAIDWCTLWDDMRIFDLGLFDLDEQLLHLAAFTGSFLQGPTHRKRRAVFSSTQSFDQDLRLSGELALDLHDILTAFGQEITLHTTSPITGKVKYAPLTDLDIVTTKTIIEVSNQPDASGKVAQLAVLLGSVANPDGLPVFHYFPNLESGSRAAQALRAAGSAGVYNDRAALVSTIRSLC